MTLTELYQKQKVLDENIIKTKKLTLPKKIRLALTILALIVETCEFANATRCFKFWSNKGMEDRETLLEEYVDKLHFFLSIGNIMDFTPKEVEAAYIKKNEKNFKRQKEGY